MVVAEASIVSVTREQWEQGQWCFAGCRAEGLLFSLVSCGCGSARFTSLELQPDLDCF